MRTLILAIAFLVSLNIHADSSPDSVAVSKLYSTSWSLVEKYRPSGIFHRLKKIPTDQNQQRITIYNNEFHISVNDGPYQICPSRLRNQNEFWLDCKEADQIIYRVIRIDDNLLIMDVLSKPKGGTRYIRSTRNYYNRMKN